MGGGSYFWKGGSQKGEFGRTPPPRTPPLVTGLVYSMFTVEVSCCQVIRALIILMMSYRHQSNSSVSYSVFPVTCKVIEHHAPKIVSFFAFPGCIQCVASSLSTYPVCCFLFCSFMNISEFIWAHNSSTCPPYAVMLVSHCGEYMANGLTNAVRHEFVMIGNDRQTFVCYASLTLWRISLRM